MTELRSKLIRLAHAKPELRKDLLPLLKRAADEDTVTLTREGYKLLAKLLDGFEEPGPWGHVVSYAIAGKPMEARHVKKVVADIDRDLDNWAFVSKHHEWTAKDKKNLTQAKGLLENNMGK